MCIESIEGMSKPKQAVLIGINYVQTPSVGLRGCINDVMCVRNLLMDAFGYQKNNIVVLRDDVKEASEMPTRQNIMNALTSLVNNSVNLEEVWIHYSGHGTNIADTNSDEKDGKDEAIVPCDYARRGLLTDDQLFGILRNLKCPAFIFMDCCHSGTICDFQWAFNYDVSKKAVGVAVNENSKNVMTNQFVYAISGSRDDQTSADAFNSETKMAMGAFTQGLIETIRGNNYVTPVSKLYSGTCDWLVSAGYKQLPLLTASSSNLDYSLKRMGATAIPVQVSGATREVRVEVPIIKEVIKEVRIEVPIIKEVIKEVEKEVEVVREVIKEVRVEVPVVKEVIKEVIKEVEKEVIKEVRVEVPVSREVRVEVPVIKEVRVEVSREAPKEITVPKSLPVRVLGRRNVTRKNFGNMSKLF